MSRLDERLEKYRDAVALPWKKNLSGEQKVWFVVYNEGDERRLRNMIGEFELATRQADHGWVHVDLTNSFPEWMADQEYREAYFEAPEDLDLSIDLYKDHVADQLREVLSSSEVDDETVVALSGVGTLFGFVRVSEVLDSVYDDIRRGRLVVFFPGEYHDNTYRLLDARDGWSYLAHPITA